MIGLRLAAVAAVVAVAAVTIATAVAAAAATTAAASVAPAAARTVSAVAALVAGADRSQLIGCLASDVGVVRQAQADSAALLVDLDHAHVDLVAAVEHGLDRLGPLAGLDVRDVQQAVGALGELDERAERRRLDDLAVELVADLDLLGHRPDPIDQGVGLSAGRRVDQDGAVLLHVDLRLELVGEGANRLAALADDHPD